MMAKEEELLAKTKRRMKELWGGETTYLPKQKKQKSSEQTVRTTQTIRGLRAAGLTEKEIAKFMPKGKK